MSKTWWDTFLDHEYYWPTEPAPAKRTPRCGYCRVLGTNAGAHYFRYALARRH